MHSGYVVGGIVLILFETIVLGTFGIFGVFGIILILGGLIGDSEETNQLKQLREELKSLKHPLKSSKTSDRQEQSVKEEYVEEENSSIMNQIGLDRQFFISLKKVLFVVVIVVILGVIFSLFPSTSVNETKEYGSGPSTSSIETLSTRCATVKVTCNEILGNYASLKLREDDYTRQGMKADYDKLIRGYEDDLFPKCKEQLSGCN